MSKPTILCGRKFPENVEARLARDYDVRLNPDDTLYSADELVAKAEGCDGLMICHSEHLTPDVVSGLPDSVKVVANFSVGYDHCNLDALKAKGIVVTNTPDVLSDATAEIAVLCALGAARRASEGDRMVRDGKWDFWSPAFMVGTQITGKRLGVVGMGRVGQVTAKRLNRGFDMEVHYHNRRQLSGEVEADLGGAIYHKDLDSLLAVSDVLSLHCPNTPDTQNLMNAARFAKLPKGAVVVNTARGAILDEDALYDALSSGHLAAAGLDVFKVEPGGNPKLADAPNLFMLPHIGSATFDTRDAMGFRALDNLDAFFKGDEPGDRVA